VEGHQLKDKFEFIRLPVLLVVLFFIGRIVMGMAGAPYEAVNRVFSMVILQTHLAVIWGAVGRAYRKYRLTEAVSAVVLIMLVSQILILAATGVSYAGGWSTYFNHPSALSQSGPVPFGTAMGLRIGGLIVNCLFGAILGVIGWLMGGLIPADRKAGS
jgi:hypothetical protein